jgi:hypothetical protein
MRSTYLQEGYQRKLDALNTKLASPRKVNRDEDTIFTKSALEEIPLELDDLKKDRKLLFTHSLVKNEVMN